MGMGRGVTLNAFARSDCVDCVGNASVRIYFAANLKENFDTFERRESAFGDGTSDSA